MALALVQNTSNDNATTVISYTITVSSTGAGNLLVCHVYTQGSAAEHISSVSDGTNTFAHVGEVSGTIGGLAGTWDTYYLLSSTSGKTTITITYVFANGAFKWASFFEVSGFTTPAVETSNGTQTTQAVGGTITGASVGTAGSGFIAALAAPANAILQNPKTGNAFTTGGPLQDGVGAVSLITSGSGTYVPAWVGDTDGQDVALYTVAFKETAVPPKVPRQAYMMPFLAQ